MAKFTLDIEEDFDYTLIGISYHQKLFKLAWAMNKALDADYKKGDDFLVKKTFSQFIHHNSFKFFNDKTDMFYQLIENKGYLISHKGDTEVTTNDGNVYLVPEYKNLDYFLYIKGVQFDTDFKLFLADIKTIPSVLSCFDIDLDKIKSKYIFSEYDPFKQNKNSGHTRAGI